MFSKFRQRSLELERLDRGDYTDEEYARWEREMRFIHGFFGERRALKNSLIAQIKSDPSETVTILDVGAGTGVLTAEIKKEISGRNSLVVGADNSVRSVSSIKNNSIAPVMCDALHLPFADGSIDYVVCSLTLHHFDSEKAVELLRQTRRVARKKIFVIDLDRSAAAYYLYRFFGSLFLQPFSRDDGALSILRAYTEPELKELATEAGWRTFEIKRSLINRLVLSGSA